MAEQYVPVTPAGTPLVELAAKTEAQAWAKLLKDAAHMPYKTIENFKKTWLYRGEMEMTDTKHTAAQPLDLDKLEALAKAATPGPWTQGSTTLTTHRGSEGSWWELHSIMMAPEGKAAHWKAGFVRDESNAAFIAAANPAVILQLIAQARTARLDTTASARERAAFEVWATTTGPWAECFLNLMWDAWIARATLAPVAAQQAAAAPIKQYIGDRMVRFVVAPAGAKVTFGPDENTVHVEFAQQAAAQSNSSSNSSTNCPTSAAKAPAAQAVELAQVQEQIEQGSGFWHSCSGCYDTEDGHPTANYAYSNVFGCALGNGCSECGGIGAVWDNTDYEAMARDWDDIAAPASAQPADTAELVQLRAQNMLLVSLYDAVAKLVKAKGRFHTEQNYRQLVAAYDLVRTADAQPADALERAMARIEAHKPQYTEEWLAAVLDGRAQPDQRDSANNGADEQKGGAK